MSLLTYLKRHKKNDDRPYAIGGLAGLFAVLIIGVFGLSLVDHSLLRSGSFAAVISAVLVDLTNGDRGAGSLGGLAISPVLTIAAQAKADDMAAKGYFAHVSPEGKDPWYWFRQQGYTFLYAGENLAVDFSDSIDVERAWMNSPTHRANILNGNFTQIGIATARGVYQGRATTFVVQMFGLPAQAGTPGTKSDLVPGKPVSVQTIVSPEEPTTLALATTEAVLGTEADSITAPVASPVRNLISNGASWWQLLFASPKSMLRYAYYALAAVVLVLLAYVTELEFHRRHMHHLTAALLLFVLMAGLFTLANFIFFTQPVIIATAGS